MRLRLSGMKVPAAAPRAWWWKCVRVFLRGRAEGVGPGRSHAPVFGREEDQELRRLRLIRRRLLENDVLDLHGRPDRTIGADLVRSHAVGGKAAMALRQGRGRGLGRALAFASLEAIAGPPHHRPLRHGCRYAVHGRQHVALASGHLYAVRHMCVGRCPPRVRPAGFHLFQIDGPDGVGVILMLVVAAVGSSRH